MATNGAYPAVTIVIVGGGAIAQTHAKYIKENPDSVLVAVVDPFESGRSLAEKYSVPCYESLTAQLESSNGVSADLYMVCTPNSLHIPVSTDVINLAKPKAILVEKPISTDTESAIAFLKLAAEKGVKVTVGHHRRFHHAIHTAKKAITSGSIGSITAISCLWTCKKNDGYYKDSPWRTSRKAGGGPVWTNLIHDVDCLNYLVGSRVIRVWATGAIKRREHAGVDEDDSVDEGAAIMVQFANGVVGTIVLSDNVPSPYNWESGTGDNEGIPKAVTPVDNYRLFGSRGTISVPDGLVWAYNAEEVTKSGKELGWGVPLTREVLKAGHGITYEGQIAHLVKLVRGAEDPICSGADGLAAVQVCQAVVDALEQPNKGPIELA